MWGWMSRAAISASCWKRSPHARQRPCLGPQDLHRRPAFEPLVEGVEDPGHAAFAQQAVDAVPAADQGRRARLHRGCVPRGPS